MSKQSAKSPADRKTMECQTSLQQSNFLSLHHLGRKIKKVDCYSDQHWSVQLVLAKVGLMNLVLTAC